VGGAFIHEAVFSLECQRRGTCLAQSTDLG